jgi:hypothetical protein
VAPSLAGLIATQLAAGAAWGITLMAIFTAALEAGRPGREGLATESCFSLLGSGGVVADCRGLVAGSRRIRAFETLAWLPGVVWALASGLIAVLALRQGRPGLA